MANEPKKPLRDAFPEHTLMTIAECIEHLNWSTEYSPDDERGTGAITCSCGVTVKCGGWVGTEHAWCPACGKGMQDMTGILPAGNAVAGMVDLDRYEVPADGRQWAPLNVWNPSPEPEVTNGE